MLVDQVARLYGHLAIGGFIDENQRRQSIEQFLNQADVASVEADVQVHSLERKFSRAIETAAASGGVCRARLPIQRPSGKYGVARIAAIMPPCAKR